VNARWCGWLRGRVRDGERGSVLLWVAGFAPVLLLLFVLLVDGGRKIKAEEQAQNYAAEAARTAVLAAGGPHQVNAATQAALAISAVHRYFAAAGIHGSATPLAPGRVRVTAIVSLTGPISGLTFTESATQTAQLLRGDTRGEQP
jgi:TadE-like protein.